MTQEELNRLLNKAARHRHWTDLLSERELEVFSFFTIGLWPHQICERMAIRPRELKRLKATIRKKLGLRSEIELLNLVAAYFDGPGSLNLARWASKEGAAPVEAALKY
ncbi:MAG: LuxR C-terminal-related transcriptional regulator [Verrucomicrobiales bacterium]|nr:LuxR C-terminal-related transcriptional regulator [Verrucomicrobiales bacterium]